MNYADIVSLSLSYSDRSDLEVTSRVDNFIEIVEARMNRLLETRRMSARSIVATIKDQEYYGLPSNWAGMRDIEIYGTSSDPSSAQGRQTLQYLTPEQMNQKTGLPTATYSVNSQIYYTIVANQIQIFPTQDSRTMEIVYYQTVPNLNATDTDNWLSFAAPDAYIFGILVEISAFVKDATTSSLWDNRFLQVMNQISDDDKNDRWSGGTLQVRLT